MLFAKPMNRKHSAVVYNIDYSCNARQASSVSLLQFNDNDSIISTTVIHTRTITSLQHRQRPSDISPDTLLHS